MRTIFWLVITALVCAASTAAASDSQADRATLAGLPAISVVVEDLPSIATSNGLATMALQADAERRLRSAGIALTPDSDAYLYVHVTIADPGASLPVPYYVEVALIQEIKLPRGAVQSRTPLQSPTWSLSRLGMATGDRLRANIADRVAEFVDQFVRAYRSVNPK
jgi:hypothetical protein